MGKEEQEEYFGYFMCNGKKKKSGLPMRDF